MKLRAKNRIRLMQGDEVALGPGKADLLDAIQRTGSISAAAKDLGMSYRRAWMLVDTMNHCFGKPLVERSAGGSGGGGATITDTGLSVLDAYRALQGDVDALVKSRLRAFNR